jgi:hypothetical protein
MMGMSACRDFWLVVTMTRPNGFVEVANDGIEIQHEVENVEI